MQDLQVGMIGLGVMGKAMARNIVAAGFPLTVWNRSAGAIRELQAEGVAAAGNPTELAARSAVVVLCLPDTGDVEKVIFGVDGLAQGLAAGSIVVDTSTILATATQEIARRLEERHISFVDSPVSGGAKGAHDGTLSCMIGGTDAAVAAAMPVLRAIGRTHVHVGGPGAGQLVKACNQLVIATTLAGVSEAIALCESAGIDPYKMREALLAGSANSAVLEMHGRRILDNTLSPGFRSALMRKDVMLAAEAARDLDAFTPVTSIVSQLFTASCNSGNAQLDSAALGKMIRAMSRQDQRTGDG